VLPAQQEHLVSDPIQEEMKDVCRQHRALQRPDVHPKVRAVADGSVDRTAARSLDVARQKQRAGWQELADEWESPLARSARVRRVLVQLERRRWRAPEALPQVLLEQGLA
jgi:hypothetical protein